MIYEINERRIICIFGNAITLQTIRIKKFQETTACLKLQVPKINYDYQIIKKLTFKN